MTTEHAVERQAAARQVFRSNYRLNHEPQSSGEFTTKVTYLDEGSIDGRPIPASRRSLAGLHLERAAGTATGIPRRGAVPDPRSPQAAAAGLGIGLPQFGSRTSAGVPSASRTMPHPLSRMLLDRVGRAQTLERLRNAFGQGVRQSGSTVRFSRTRGDTLLELVADDSLGVVRSTRVSIAGTPRLHVSYSYVNFSHDTLLVETIRVRGEPQAGRPALESSTTVLAIRRTPKP